MGKPVFGEYLEKDPAVKERAEIFLNVVVHFIIGHLRHEGLAERLGAIQDLFPRSERHRTIVLEGQAKLPKEYLDGKGYNFGDYNNDWWMLLYGIKADKTNNK